MKYIHLIYHLLEDHHQSQHPMYKSKKKKWPRMPNIIKNFREDEAAKNNKQLSKKIGKEKEEEI